MAGFPYPRGRGRGRGANLDLEFYEDRPGRNPGTSYVRRDPVSNNYKLHVRSIPLKWNPTIFRNVFSKCGDPKSVYMQPHRPPNTLTWGFVEYEQYEEALTAVRELNNNLVLDGIQVMFAREKPSEEAMDPILRMFNADAEEDDMSYQSVEPLADPRTIVRTVTNESNLIKGAIHIDVFQKPIADAEAQACIEEALFQRILKIYKESACSTSKCNLCEASCSSACSGCTTVFYCSEDCQNRDWTIHSRNCPGANMGAAEDSGFQSRGGGDHRQTNGFGSSEPERENRFDNRTNRFGDRNNRDSDRGNSRNGHRESDRGFNRGGQNANSQPPKRSILEERRLTKMAALRPNENEGGFQNRFGQNNQRHQNGQETRSSFKPRTNTVQADDDDWGSKNQDNGAKDSSATTPGLDFINKEKAFLQEIKIKKEVEATSFERKESITVEKEIQSTSVNVKQEIKNGDLGALAPAPAPVPAVTAVNASTTAAEEIVLQPGSMVEVTIYHTEDRGLFWVQKPTQQVKFIARFAVLKEHFETCSTQFNPIQNGVCGINYEDQWYRCQITSLDPLTVHYIDFGYPETVEPNKLFELSPELKSLPRLVFKIKLVDGTSESYLLKGEGETLKVKLIEKVDDCWLAQVVGDDAVSTAAPEVKVAAKTDPPEEETTLAPVEPDKVPVQPVQTNKPVVAETPPSAVQKPYPPMLDATRFTTVVVTYPGGTEEKDTYYVGASTAMVALTEMCIHLKNVIQQCEVQTPELGRKGLAMFENGWYRVEIVSMNPKILAYYIDYGNTEPLDPENFRKCPETHVDIPNLVHKVKLAPGTDNKFFNLPEESEISVKPVAWLPDGTVVVQVEGENYTKETSQASVSDTLPTAVPTPTPQSTASTDPGPSVESTPTAQPTASTVPTPVPQPAASTVPAPAPSTVSSPSAEPAPTSQPTASPVPAPVLVEPTPSWTQGTVDLLQEEWKISFLPNKEDFVKNSLIGQVYCVKIDRTFSFMAENEKFQSYLSSHKYDPNFKPNVGEVVGVHLGESGWERARVLPQQGLVALNDQGGVVRCSELHELPELYTEIPSMASVLTLSREDPDLLSCLVAEDEIVFDVVKVTKDKDRVVVSVLSSQGLEGVMRSWTYDPLETPDPLGQGQPVTISKVLDSNTLLVAPANDLEIQQAIQIDCRKSSEDFKCPPKEGDYVSFLDKESDGYFRCRIDKVNGDAYTIYAVDDATCYQAKLSDLRPLPKSLRNVPCRISQISLKDVDKVHLTEQAQIFVCHIVEEDKSLTVAIEDGGKATLTIEGEEETLNSKLKKLLTPKVVPNSDGKLTAMVLTELKVPLNQEFDLIVAQTEPLYVQLSKSAVEYFLNLHEVIQKHCAEDKSPYNPCQGEYCLAVFDGYYYRCRCMRETNTGVAKLMLVDYGTMFEVKTEHIRRILPEMLTMASLAISCKIHGLPDHISPALKAKLNEILQPDSNITGVFLKDDGGSYILDIKGLQETIQGLQ